MWRKIFLTFVAGLVASMLIISNYINSHHESIQNIDLFYAILALWVLLMWKYGTTLILIIVFCHFMKIGIIKIQLMELLMVRPLTSVQLQDSYHAALGKELRLNDILEAMRNVINLEWVTYDSQEFNAQTPLHLTPTGIRHVQKCRSNGTAGLRHKL